MWTSVKRSRKFKRFFCKLVASFLGQNCVKGLRVTKINEQIKFEGVWSKLEAKKVSRDNISQNDNGLRVK